MNILVHVSLDFVRASLVKCPSVFPQWIHYCCMLILSWQTDSYWGPRIQALAAEMMWFKALAGTKVVFTPQLHVFHKACRAQPHLAILESKNDYFAYIAIRLLTFLAKQGSNFVQCFVWSEWEMTKHFYTFQFLDCSRGRCGFSNWWHPLLLLTAVSSIPWYSLLLCVPLLRSNCFF